jgi:plastocyanin
LRAIAALCFFAVFSHPSWAAQTVVIQMFNNFFSPANVTINVGDTVTWRASTSGHDTKSVDNLWASPNPMPVNTTFSHTFNTAGSFGYFCTPHRAVGMVGTITVQGAANQPPTVSLTAPADGGTFSTTDSITFSANANDDAGVNRVEFYSDGNLIGTDTSSPYSVTATLPAGQHSITAKAFDGPGLSATSGPRTITVNAPQNQAPSVNLTGPQNGATFLTTDTITFSADANDDAGVNRVEFYSDGNLIGTDTSAPYSVTASLSAGQHSITAKAFDGPGLSATSGAITITVNTPNQPPTVTLTAPANNATFSTTDTITFTADATDDAGVNRVEFYSDGNLIGTDTSAPYSVTASLPAGTHSITAKAFDGPDLSTISTAIQIQVSSTASAPSINAVTRNGSNTTIIASATDGVAYDLQATTNFVDWAVVDTKTAAAGSVTLSDTTTESMRFYRVAAH